MNAGLVIRLARAGFMHLDDKGCNTLKHYAALRVLNDVVAVCGMPNMRVVST